MRAEFVSDQFAHVVISVCILTKKHTMSTVGWGDHDIEAKLIISGSAPSKAPGGEYMKILVCVDLSEDTEIVVEKAENVALAMPSKVWFLHVADPDPDFVGYKIGPQSVRDALAEEFHQEHRQLQSLADTSREKGLDTTALLVQGPTVETILRDAAKLDADMIVMGSHGRGLMYQLIVGSVSEGVLHKAQCPVLVVPTHKRDKH